MIYAANNIYCGRAYDLDARAHSVARKAGIIVPLTMRFASPLRAQPFRARENQEVKPMGLVFW